MLELTGISEVREIRTLLERMRVVGEFPAVEEIVPAGRTILFDGVDDPAGLLRFLEEVLGAASLGGAGDARYRRALRDLPPTLEIGVVYDGPDLEVVASQWSTTPEGVIGAHTGVDHLVEFLGFAPGFAYMSGIGPRRHVSRRTTPRREVPAGSVALAGEFTGVYPRSSPGGWQLVGRTDVRLWDPDRAQPALLTPGARVRFLAL